MWVVGLLISWCLITIGALLLAFTQFYGDGVITVTLWLLGFGAVISLVAGIWGMWHLAYDTNID